MIASLSVSVNVVVALVSSSGIMNSSSSRTVSSFFRKLIFLPSCWLWFALWTTCIIAGVLLLIYVLGLGLVS